MGITREKITTNEVLFPQRAADVFIGSLFPHRIMKSEEGTLWTWTKKAKIGEMKDNEKCKSYFIFDFLIVKRNLANLFIVVEPY